MATNALNMGNVSIPGIPLAAFSVPVTTGLEGVFLFTDGLVVAGMNFATGKPDGQVVGAPVANAGYVRFSAATGYLQTQAAESADMTIMGIFRRPATGNTPFVGNYGSSGGIGVGLYTTTDDRVYATAGRDGAGPVNNFATGAITSWALVAARMPASGTTRIQNLTAATSAVTGTGNRIVSSNGPLRVGRFNEAVFTGSNDAMMCAVFSRVLSDVELASMQVWAKDFAAAYGVTV